jgi:hypothetical protein
VADVWLIYALRAQDPARHARYRLFRAVRLVAPRLTPSLKQVLGLWQRRWRGARAVEAPGHWPLQSQQDSDRNAGGAATVCASSAGLGDREDESGTASCRDRNLHFPPTGDASGDRGPGEALNYKACGVVRDGAVLVTSVQAFSDEIVGKEGGCGSEGQGLAESRAVREAWTPAQTHQVKESEGLDESRLSAADSRHGTNMCVAPFATHEVLTGTDGEDCSGEEAAEDILSGTTTVSSTQDEDVAVAGDPAPVMCAPALLLALYEVYLRCTLQVWVLNLLS